MELEEGVTAEHPPQNTASEDTPIDPQLLQVNTSFPASATPNLEPTSSVRPVRAAVEFSNTPLPTTSSSRQPTTDNADQRERREVFELFHDALEAEQLVVDADDDVFLTITSASIDEAADALYPCLRQLFSTGKAESPLPFSPTSISNLDVKALDRTKFSANM